MRRERTRRLARLSRPGSIMRCIEVEPGRWRVELGFGLGIEIVLLFSRTLAFFCYGGGLIAEMPVGES